MTRSPARRAVVLVTGMSGTGKSTVLAALARRGHEVVDSDDAGWVCVVDGEPLWDLDLVRARLEAHRDGALFLAGCVRNQRAVYAELDAVVLLSAPVPVLLERVRDRTNPYGRSGDDRARIVADVAEFEPVLRRGATHEIVTTSAVGVVVDALERVVADA